MRRENRLKRQGQADAVRDFDELISQEPTPESRMIDANELLWAARIVAGLVRVHRHVIPDMREKVKLAQAILESYADVPDFDPRDQRWTTAKT